MNDRLSQTRIKLGTPVTYRIEVEGFLNESWSECLAGMHITIRKRPDSTAVTTLVGRLRDQAELTGVLNSLHDLQRPIVKVEIVNDD